jgi:hypothetical protein
VGNIVFRILFYLGSVVLRLAVAMAPFYFMFKAHDLTVTHFVLAMFWFPFVVAILFRSNEFQFKSNGRRRRRAKILMGHPDGLIVSPSEEAFYQHL